MRKLVIAMVFLVASATAYAEEPAAKKEPSPDEIKQLMEMSFGAMVPMMAKMAEVTIEAQLRIAEKPETARSLAAFKKNLFDALVKQGFSKKEAFDMVLNTSVPAAMPGMK